MVVSALSKIATKFRWSEFIVAFVLMGFMTSVPELFVGVSSALGGAGRLALGNVIGASIVNLTLVMGLAAILSRGIKIETGIAKRDAVLTMAIVAIPVILLLDGKLTRIEGVILILLFFVYLLQLFHRNQHRYPYFISRILDRVGIHVNGEKFSKEFEADGQDRRFGQVVGDFVKFAAGVDVTTVGTGTVTVLGGEDYSDGVDQDGNSSSIIDMNSTSSISTGGGNISLDTKGNALISSLDSGSGAVSVVSRNGSILDSNGAALNILARDYSYLRAASTNGVIGTDLDPIEVCVQINAANRLTPPVVNGSSAISGLILEIGGVDAVTGISGNLKGIVRPGSGYNGVVGSPEIDFATVLPPGEVFYEDTTSVSSTCTVLAGYPGATNSGVRKLIWPWPWETLAIIGDDWRFRMPKKNVVDTFQIAQTQGPSTLVASQRVYFYHPLVDMSMYDMPALDIGAYEFIDGQINATNPALLPIVLDEEEENKLQ